MLPIVLLSLLAPLLVIVIILVVWHYWSKDTLRVERIANKQIVIKKRLKRIFYKEEAPFGELRYPIMLLTISSVIFILLTAMFGVSIDTRDGTVEYHLTPGHYWSQPFTHKEWENERGIANAMYQYPGWIYFVMIIGYYMTIALLFYFWLEYCKWKWEHTPKY